MFNKPSIISDKMYKDLIKNPKIGHELAKHLEKSRKLTKQMKGKRFLFSDPNPGKAERFTYDNQNKEQDNLLGDLKLTEEVLTCSDETVNTAHANHKIVLDFMQECLGRNSFDAKGADLHGSVHFSTNYDNAFFTQFGDGYGHAMIYGDGLLFKPLVLALDVAAHEIGHGTTEYTSGLAYYSFSGALNESQSDVYGVCCKQWNKKEEIPTANWLIGDEIVTDKFPGKALRSFKDEKAFDGDDQPKNMKGYNWGLDDSQMVHCNSGIPNHAFYLFCMNAYEAGVKHSWEAPLDIWYHANMQLHKLSNFFDMKKATLKVCKAKYPNLLPGLQNAWKSVGL